MNPVFSLQRLLAVIQKEFIQMRRDRLTFAMIIMIPLMQLVLFGFVINTNPKHLPTAIISADSGVFTRTFVNALANTDYFDVIKPNSTEQESLMLLKRGKILFIVNIPPQFSHDLVKGIKPTLLITTDATDPAATSNALSALNALNQTVLNDDLQHGLGYLLPKAPPFTLMTHLEYNPEGISQYNIVPGLMGVVLTMTMIMITALAITRERERNTMESLLATPVRPLEVMLGKIIPYVMVGYIQQGLIITLGIYVFNVPHEGSIVLLLIATLPFIIANLSVGLMFSTIAKNQLQAVQMTQFFFLPSLLLSGFMFPFYGMPQWAQMLGNCLPLTHFLLIVRGIMLKGNGLIEIWPEITAITLFALVMIMIGVKRYRQTLD